MPFFADDFDVALSKEQKEMKEKENSPSKGFSANIKRPVKYPKSGDKSQKRQDSQELVNKVKTQFSKIRCTHFPANFLPYFGSQIQIITMYCI